ncbi:MAG: HNH endonuclease [Candidatus Omnitrophota bacterium]|jgi:5-methylcytosine-specific restriction endonuclease McrA|nr:MAG: HNH endonuclease [Candidatus Omnitrophota bacterium]
MVEKKISMELLKRLKGVTKKRPQTVINHILKYGYITTEDMQKEYGYEHPPRAARDVREEGIPLETFRVKNTEGRSIAAYRFGDLSKIRKDQLGGRKVFSKQFKDDLINEIGCKCSLCLECYENRYLQVDHRIPYEISGDARSVGRNVKDYMLLCGSCNRAKSWSCEHCLNWNEEQSEIICHTYYWAEPEAYNHIALHEIRRIDIVWQSHEIEIYERLKQRAYLDSVSIPDYVKNIINKHLLKS